MTFDLDHRSHPRLHRVTFSRLRHFTRLRSRTKIRRILANHTRVRMALNFNITTNSLFTRHLSRQGHQVTHHNSHLTRHKGVMRPNLAHHFSEHSNHLQGRPSPHFNPHRHNFRVRRNLRTTLVTRRFTRVTNDRVNVRRLVIHSLDRGRSLRT